MRYPLSHYLGVHSQQHSRTSVWLLLGAFLMIWHSFGYVQAFRFMVHPRHYRMISKYGSTLSKAMGPMGSSFLAVKKRSLLADNWLIPTYVILLDLTCETPQAERKLPLFTLNSHTKPELVKTLMFRWHSICVISLQISGNKLSFTYFSVFKRLIPRQFLTIAEMCKFIHLTH